ncbi:MAG: tyrosine-protein phosphatase [Lachnospiraceae bacterium]|nr:tyrosine-protein phosphatase [Lachnospiraceae bacterium]
MKRQIRVICALLVLGAVLAAGCGKKEELPAETQESPAAQESVDVQESAELPAVEGLQVIHELEFGGAYIAMTIEDFNESGFSFGDSVDIHFSNGYVLEDLPYYNGFYSRTGTPLLVGYPGFEYIKACINSGADLWEEAGFAEGCTADVFLREKGKYSDIQEARDIHYKDDRELYESDEVFANFRAMTGGSLKENLLYRSASPCDNRHCRAAFTDRLSKEAGVRYIINLADTEEKLETYMAGEDFDSPHFKSLYEAGEYVLLGLNANFASEDFAKKTAAGLKTAAEHEGPYLIHCTEGKDRTGFVCMLLEALAGATYEEMLDDYMITYDNYYGINETEQREKYDTIVSEVFVPMAEIIAGEGADLSKADFVGGAEEYLRRGGMDEGTIAKLKEMLTD